MKDIVATRRMENGIACYYGEKGKEEFDTFCFLIPRTFILLALRICSA